MSPSAALLVLVLKELVATDGNHGDKCHELLEVTLGVSIGIQALHQAVQGGLVLHMLQAGSGEGAAQVTSGEKHIHTHTFFLFKCGGMTPKVLLNQSLVLIYLVCSVIFYFYPPTLTQGAGMFVPHHHQLGKLVVQQILQLALLQLVFVTFSLGILLKNIDDGGHGSLQVSHHCCLCFHPKKQQNQGFTQKTFQ